jgi:hypothetical protein
VEENWVLLQTQVTIPFTTQLDTKTNLEVRRAPFDVRDIVR